MSSDSSARFGGLKGINIQFGIESNDPPKSPKVGGGAEWADIDQRMRLMSELDELQKEISQLARTQNASLTAKKDLDATPNSLINTPVSAGEETLLDLSSDSDVTDDDEADDSKVGNSSSNKLRPRGTKSINEILQKEAGALAREIRRRRKHPDEFATPQKTHDRDSIKLAMTDLLSVLKRLVKLTWMYVLAALILIVALFY